MDNKKLKIILTVFALSIAVIIPVSYSVGANSQYTGAAGSREDPLVTVSYVESAIREAVAEALQNISGAPAAGGDSESASAYELVMLARDETIRARTGSLELIVRPGSIARVISPYQDLGLANLSSGHEHTDGDTAPVNQLLLVPRADNRGLVILSEIAFVFARGDYEIE